MADNNDNNNGGSQDPMSDILVLVVLGFAAFSLITQAPGYLESRFGIDVNNPESIYQETPITENTQAGAIVETTSQLSVYDTPNGVLVGQHLRGTEGRISDGPVQAAGVNWWNVDFVEGADGWVREVLLVHKPLFSGTSGVLSFFWTASILFSLLMLSGVIYNLVRISQIRTEEREEFDRMTRRALQKTGGKQDNRWRHIIQHVESANESNWRTAIMEADIMLEDMMETMGYHQDTLGKKLKAVEPSDFTNLDKAWEAHKVRNKIAHEGKEYALTQREAQRVIGLYEDVFREFRYI